MEHLVVFIGPDAHLALELVKLESAYVGLKSVSKGVKKKFLGVNFYSLSNAMRDLCHQLDLSAANEDTYLTVWLYDGDSSSNNLAIETFGRSAWMEFIPRQLSGSARATRAFMQNRIKDLRSELHEVSSYVYRDRRRSPLALPWANFHAKHLKALKGVWYKNLSLSELSKKLKSQKDRHLAIAWRNGAHEDERGLMFRPAETGEYHGLAHYGAQLECFVSGRFRFGASLFPGFHYHLSGVPTSGSRRGKNLKCTLVECCGTSRPMTAERREYINVFPNDHLLPQKENQE